MPETKSFDRLRMTLIKLPQENERWPFDDTIGPPLRNGGAIDLAVISQLLLGPA